MPARILLFALDDLRGRFGRLVPPDADPRHDTTPFRAFRGALLDALAAAATGPAEVSMWWEGGFDGYALAVAIDPPDAVPSAEEVAAAGCAVDAARTGEPRRDRVPLARLAAARWWPARDEGGGTYEAPFGAATGHFGAPGMRRSS